MDAFAWEDRCKLLEFWPLFALGGSKAVDRAHVDQVGIFPVFVIVVDVSADKISVSKIEASDLCRRHVDIIFPGKAIFRGTKETIPIRVEF